MPPSKRTYFFEMFGKSAWGVMGEDISVWNQEGEKMIIRLKQIKHTPLMKILYYTINDSNWLTMEWGKRTEGGIERKYFYYI